jgi:plastocyanin
VAASSLVQRTTTRAITIVPGAANSGVQAPYVPAVYTVKVGTTVTWVTDDPIAHTVTSTSVPRRGIIHLGFLAYENTFSHTFTVPGTYNFDCPMHPVMRGTISS